MINFDFKTYTNNLLTDEVLEDYKKKLSNLDNFLNTHPNMAFNNLDNLFNEDLVNDIKSTAEYIKTNCDVFLIIGIGGSYLGSKAVIEALSPYFYNESKTPKIYFVGTNLSSEYYNDLLELIKDKDIILNVISKSGTTLEINIAYNLITSFMKQKYTDDELSKRIIITTDQEKGFLREEVVSRGYKSFVIPSDIGGRYSVFTPVGLLPIAVAGFDIKSLYKGALKSNENLDDKIKYAIIRKLMSEQGKTNESFVVYEPKLYWFTEWLKQLYGESLGKEGKGMMPISCVNTKDLHSLGQFVQEGNNILFETVINVLKSKGDIFIPEYNKTLNEINNIASTSTSIAHKKANVINNIITVEQIDEESIGYLLQFFMISCVISAYLDEVNPFDQNGVEEYKKVIRELL
ncbi:MAG TPA: glucose-6-phosphate isomerase [Mollicutes bacterium]|nr:glucose-6-phosphate isomerase [Mollicutes bacterium]